jgi:cytochrome oxidase Cu insertion factor (SCO1/SenC/PrrC family)
MSSGLSPSNSTIVSAFQTALLHQALVVVIILVLLAVAWNLLRSVQLRSAVAAGVISDDAPVGSSRTTRADRAPARHVTNAPPRRPTPIEIWAESEPSGRRLLRVGFGLLWIFDGILQGQTSMPIGMTSSVIEPTTRMSPHWVQHIVNFGIMVWSDHPVVAAAAVVWIQLGIGLWLLVAPRGYWSRAAGVASIGWGLVVWVFGEAFGGLFAPSVSWLFGAPGAVLLYCCAGVLVALADRRWASGRLPRGILRLMGLFFLVMGGLQAWPGRGFWQGRLSNPSSRGPLAAMLRLMAATPQPRVSSSWLSSFASFDSAHGFAVNLFVVIALVAIGVGLMSRRPTVIRWTAVAAAVVCLADWVLVQDLGFFGGTGTDPNSMIPILVIVVAGYLGITRTVVTVEAEVLDPELQLAANLEGAFDSVPTIGPAIREPRIAWRERVRTRPVYVFRVLAAIGAAAVVVLGAAPIAVASLEHGADQIVSQSFDGQPVKIDVPAPAFTLRNQFGQVVSLSSLRGKVIVLTFLDPVCPSDCPVLAEELRQTASLLSADAGEVQIVAIVANPIYRSVSTMQTFDVAEGLNRLPNWLYLTGPVPHLRAVWNRYGIVVELSPAGAMVAHSDFVFVIDNTGIERFLLNADPGPGTAATKSSFASSLATTVRRVLATQ